MDESGLLYSVKLVFGELKWSDDLTRDKGEMLEADSHPDDEDPLFGELKLSDDLTRDKGEVLEADSHPDDEDPLDESLLPSKLYQDTKLEWAESSTESTGEALSSLTNVVEFSRQKARAISSVICSALFFISSKLTAYRKK